MSITANLLSLILLAADAASSSVSLQYLGHSCFVITTPSGMRLLIDPYATGEWPGLDFPPTRADRVLVSHPHWDHDAWRSVSGDPETIDAPGNVPGKDFMIRGIAGRHADLGGGAIGHRNTIFIIETGGFRICHLGDNGPPSSDLAAAIGRVDVLMVPIDAELRVLTYEQARGWIDALSPRIVLPMHYRVPGRSLDRIQGLGTLDEWLSRQVEVNRLPGDTLVLDAARMPQAGAGAVHLLTLPGQKPPDPRAQAPGRAEAQRAIRRAEVAVAEGDIPTALQEFTRAAALDPGDAEVLEKIGYLHLGSARPDRALEFLSRAAREAGEGDPRTASLAWLGSGMALDLLGRREEALAAYRKVLELGVNSDHQVDQARRYLESPYTED